MHMHMSMYTTFKVKDAQRESRVGNVVAGLHLSPDIAVGINANASQFGMRFSEVGQRRESLALEKHDSVTFRRE